MEHMIDLHAHTTFSDGSMSPVELIEYACKKQLKAIAITDHDCVDGIRHLQKINYVPCKEIEIVPGIELSSKISGHEIHILGYFLDVNHPGLHKKLELLKKTRAERNLKMLQRLQMQKIDISEEEISVKGSHSISRAHIASLLVKKGYVPDYKTAFNQYLSSHGSAYVERERLTPKDSIETIQKAGGLAFLAHLNQIDADKDELYTICQTLKGYGLCGIEAYYSEYDNNWNALCAGILKRFDFLATGGSDFHGTHKPGLDLGVGYGRLKIPYSLLQSIKNTCL
jgi:predicted metal-dependent phosphoesterase TrpH